MEGGGKDEKEEIEKVYSACPGYLRSIVAVAIRTGMRKEEILELKWPDIDFRRKIITILKTKNRKKREFSKEVRLF